MNLSPASHQAPTLHLTGNTVQVRGEWLAQQLVRGQSLRLLQTQLSAQPAAHWQTCHWNLHALIALDHIGAQVLWQAWGQRLPAHLEMNDDQREIFLHLQQASGLQLPQAPKNSWNWIHTLGEKVFGFFSHLQSFVMLMGQISLDFLYLLRHPMRGPWKEISANIYRAGYQALGITALVGVLIGIVLSYLSAHQLRNFGADVFLVNLLGISIIRELGPMLAAILVAGRSGSAITAQLGVMRVTEELDAMAVMGIPHGFRLLLPKVLALAIAMPLLVIWTDAAALLGGMLAASLELGMAPEFFLLKLRDAVPLVNYWLGLAKGVTFGILIALVACHFGLRIKPNTESLGRGTTSSVVTSITIVIFADAIFAVVFRGKGIMF